MTALNHMTDEDLKVMGIPMVHIELVLDFPVGLVPMAISCSSIDNFTHVEYGGNVCNLKCALDQGPFRC